MSKVGKKGWYFMSNVVVPLAVNPVSYSLVAGNKGDISNRAKCAGAQFVNQAKGIAGLTAVGAGATLLTRATLKSPSLTKNVAKAVDWLLKKLPSSKVVSKLLSESPKTKAVGYIVALAASAAAYIAAKTIYKAGQIDQKYTDRATWEERTKAVFDNA